MSANDRQVGGSHYAEGDNPQHWDLVSMYGWDYFQAQAIKYIMRWRRKNGVQDLEKAVHVLQKYIEIAKEEERALERIKAGGAAVQREAVRGQAVDGRTPVHPYTRIPLACHTIGCSLTEDHVGRCLKANGDYV